MKQGTRACAFPIGLIVLVLMSLFLGGCSSQGFQPSDRASPRGQAQTEAALPPLDEPLPPLDGGRIVVAGPKGWYYPPRSAKYVFRVQKSADRGTPLIALTAEDSMFLTSLAPNTASTYIEQLAEEHQKKPESYVQLQLGGRTWVAYRRRGREPGRVGVVYDILAFETVVGGRRYILRLVCDPSELDQWEPYLRAVAAGMQFLIEGELLADVPQAGVTKELAASKAHAPTKSSGKETVPSPEVPRPVSGQESSLREPAEKPAAHSEKPKPAGAELDLEALEELLR